MKNNKSYIFDKDLEERFFNGEVFSDKNISVDILKNTELKIYNIKEEFIGLLIYDPIKSFWKPKNIIK